MDDSGRNLSVGIAALPERRGVGAGMGMSVAEVCAAAAGSMEFFRMQGRLVRRRMMRF